MQFTNTMSRKKEKFKPLKEEKVKIYYCGPTPYNFAHIGNLRAYLFSDMVVRTMRFLGYKVETTMNITDIDDKTIRNSIKEWVDLITFTERYTKLFFEDIEKLGIRKADNISPISHLIDEMVLIINGLLAKWYAYLAPDNSIYYSIAKFKKYWELAHLDFKWMKTSVRIDNDEYDKEQAADFVLWKAYDKSKDWPNKWSGKFVVNWEEKIIEWRPGWHIECSACNLKFFWDQIDIHMWWIDNIFPHHQNEIAQTEAYTGKIFSKYWIHSWHLLVDNQKMAKSKWNFYTLRDIEEKMKDKLTPAEIHKWFRLMNFQARYEESFNFSFDKLAQAAATLKNFSEILKRIKNYPVKEWKFSKEVSENLQYFIQKYIEFLEDDFDTPNALTVVFEFIKYVNLWIDANSFSKKEITWIIDVLKTFNQVLELFDFKILESSEEVPTEILELLEQRTQAKIDKNFTLADEIRDKITALGYNIIDDKNGVRVERR